MLVEKYEFWGVKMTKQQRTEATNLAWDGMEKAQMILECSDNKHDRSLAKAMYEAFWCMYQVLVDDKRRADKNGN